MDYKDKKKSPFDPTVYDKLYAELSKQEKEDMTEPLWPGLSNTFTDDKVANAPEPMSNKDVEVSTDATFHTARLGQESHDEEEADTTMVDLVRQRLAPQSASKIFTEQELEDRLRAYADRLMASANRLAATGLANDTSISEPSSMMSEPKEEAIEMPDLIMVSGSVDEVEKVEYVEAETTSAEPVVDNEHEDIPEKSEEEPVAASGLPETPKVAIVAEGGEDISSQDDKLNFPDDTPPICEEELPESEVKEKEMERDKQKAPAGAVLVSADPIPLPPREVAPMKKKKAASIAPVAKAPVKIIPMVGTVINKNIKLTNMGSSKSVRITVEEDVLVPDVKPDLAAILLTEGSCHLSEDLISAGSSGLKEARVSGNIHVQTLYTKMSGEGKELIIPVESKIPFKEDVEVSLAPGGELSIKPVLESLNYEIINERKFRIRGVIALHMSVYDVKELNVFEGVAGENLQCMRKPISYTEMYLRKKESVEISEEIKIKDNGSDIKEILAVRVNAAENHRQLGMDKVVLSGTLYCTILYLGYDSDGDGEKLDCFRDKIDFTQFIQLTSGEINEVPNGSDIHLKVKDFSIMPKDDDLGVWNTFSITSEIETTMELYGNREIFPVEDLYHPEKDLRYDQRKEELNRIIGNARAEVTAREPLNISESKGRNINAIYVTGMPKIDHSFVEDGKSRVEGSLDALVACAAGNSEGHPFTEKVKIPFRASVDIPEASSGMKSQNEIILKDLWVEKIGGRQMEVNARMLFNSRITDKEECLLIENLNFLETEDKGRKASIIAYIAREGDDLWKVAKKYRAPIESIQEVNQLDGRATIKEGDRILIVR